ncbi:MAG: hypothetical protein NVSMB34_05500 [Variovorax sp.]
MTTFLFSDAPAEQYQVIPYAQGAQVGDARLPVHSAGAGAFTTTVDGRSERLHAVAHGDAVYVQLKGRAWRVERVDPARSNGSGATGAAGASLAPMPGVVVSLHAEIGQPVQQGDPLLVIESMKLQMAIGAAADGVVVELPVAIGQTFQRGAVLVRISAAGSVA